LEHKIADDALNMIQDGKPVASSLKASVAELVEQYDEQGFDASD
jgi:hypothetical protein